MHLVEAQPRGLADQLLELGRILQARHLHEDARAALAHDVGLGGAHGVDAPAHRLDGGADGAGDAMLQAGLGRGDADHAAVRLGHLEIGDGGAEDEVAGLLDEAAQGLEGGVRVLGLDEPDLHGVVGDADRGDGDLGLAQPLAGIIAQRVQPVLAHIGDLHGEQQMRAAAQVEAEGELRLRHPARPGRERLLGHEIGDHQQDAEQTGEDDGDLLPRREMQHGLSACRPLKLLKRAAPRRPAERAPEPAMALTRFP